MADRNRSTNPGEFKNYTQMRPAGGAVTMDNVSKKPSVNDGKGRLFGVADENEFSGSMVSEPYQSGGQKNTGKRIMNSHGASSFNNVIGG
jgi:hypothetical protein